MTRGQTAACMNRLGALGEGQDRVADATELNGFPAENYVFAPASVSPLGRSVDFEPGFSAIHQLHGTPAGIEPCEINVPLDTRTDGLGEGEYNV